MKDDWYLDKLNLQMLFHDTKNKQSIISIMCYFTIIYILLFFILIHVKYFNMYFIIFSFYFNC